MQLGCHGLFSVLSNNGKNQTLCLCSVSWFTEHFPIHYVILLTKQSYRHPARRKTVLRRGVSTALRQQSILMRTQALESEDLGKNIGSDQLWNLKPSDFSVLLYRGWG